MKAVFDTNILIDYLVGHQQARTEIERFDARLISVVTWIEVMVGTTRDDEGQVRRFLDRFELCPLDRGIAEATVRLRKAHRLRIPDAAIWATALNADALLVTRNTRDFPRADPSVRVPYRL